MQRRRGDRPVLDGGERKDRVHRQHVLNEDEIGVVVGHVAEGDQAGEQRDGGDQRGLGRTDGDHGSTTYLNSCIASSASTPPVIVIGTNGALAATSALDSMI